MGDTEGGGDEVDEEQGRDVGFGEEFAGVGSDAGIDDDLFEGAASAHDGQQRSDGRHGFAAHAGDGVAVQAATGAEEVHCGKSGEREGREGMADEAEDGAGFALRHVSDGGGEDAEDGQGEDEGDHADGGGRSGVLGFLFQGRNSRDGDEHAPGDPASIEDAAGDGHGDGDGDSVEDGFAEVGSQELRGGGGGGVGRNQSVRDGERSGDGETEVEERGFRFAGETPDERNEDDEADFKEDGEADEEGGGEDGPDGALAAELVEEPVREGAASAGVFEEAADHGSQGDDDGDEAEGVAEAGLHGFEDLGGVHTAGEAKRGAGDHEGEEGVEAGPEDEDQEESDSGQGEEDEGRATRHESAIVHGEDHYNIGMVAITWLGHGTFQLTLDSGEVVLIDPWVQGNPAYPAGFEIAKIDTMLITHGHFDHIADAVSLARKHSPQVIANYEICAWLESKGVKNACGMNKGVTQAAGSLKVTMTHAVHSCGISDEGKIIYGGDAGGYVLHFADGRVAYFAGDTAVFSDMALIRELYQPELCFLPIGDLFTMDPREAALACKLLQPKKVIPMHFGTFPPLTGRPGALAALVAGTGVEIWPVEPGKAVTW